MATVILTKRNVEKSGNVAYSREGVRASVYFNKQMFSDPSKAPDSIELTVPDGVLAEPGAVKTKMAPAEAIAKAQALAEKARVAAEKARVRAEKAAARAAKLTPAQ